MAPYFIMKSALRQMKSFAKAKGGFLMNIIIGNAWPYANGPLHLGRIAVWLPGDVLARYHRMMGDNVVFVSGTDCHGMPVTNRAEEEGITPLEAVEKYHNEFQRCFKSLGFSFDIFEKTHSEYHEEKVKEFILDLYKKGYIYENIEGEVKHLVFALSKFEDKIRDIFENEDGWRENAQKILKRYLDEGLRDKAVTRDFNWGVDVPLDGYEDKKIYVWIEAVMGYVTASMKCLEQRNEDFKSYWSGEDSRIYFVHGKDNIPFHTVILPAILLGIGIEEPNIRIVSGEHLRLEGKPFSAVKNWALWADYITKNYNVDSFRYYLMLNSPEDKDTDFTWRDYINSNNIDLADNLSKYISKVLSFSRRNYGPGIPNGSINEELKNEILDLYFEAGDDIEEGHFSSALEKIISFCKKSNKDFQENNLWEMIEKNPSKCREKIYNNIQVIANLSNLLEPFMPFTCEKIRASLSINEPIWSFIEKKDGILREANLGIDKIDRKRAADEVFRLKEKRK